MIRWPLLAVCALAPLSGCQWLGVDRDGFNRLHSRARDVPTTSPATVAVATRVQTMGRRLVIGSPFLGIDPKFQVIGLPEPEIFHPDSVGVYVTDGMAGLCRKDEELAAVLAKEMGQMAAESRRAERLLVRDPIPAVAMGGPGDDPAREAYLVEFEKEVGKPGERKAFPVTDATVIARQILSDAGFDPKCLDDAQPILRKANRTQVLATQLGGRSAAPKWNE